MHFFVLLLFITTLASSQSLKEEIAFQGLNFQLHRLPLKPNRSETYQRRKLDETRGSLDNVPLNIGTG